MIENDDGSRALRNALGRFATGVTIVTAIDPDGHPIGLTANSFSAVSLNPPLVLWCLDNTSHNLAAFRRAGHHAINVLAAGQLDLSNRFATWPVDRFAGLHWHPGTGGVPLLPAVKSSRVWPGASGCDAAGFAGCGVSSTMPGHLRAV